MPTVVAVDVRCERAFLGDATTRVVDNVGCQT
jgi:hypothetical protein